MAPEVRKYHIEASKRGRPDQQSYGSQLVMLYVHTYIQTPQK